MAENSLGKKILAAIRRVLHRCDEVGERIDFPGEGGERRFRSWIASELLEECSTGRTRMWPSASDSTFCY